MAALTCPAFSFLPKRLFSTFSTLLLLTVVAAPSAIAQPSVLTVKARGAQGGEGMEVQVDGSSVGTVTLSNSFQNYEFQVSASFQRVEVHYPREDNRSQDIQVDFIMLGGQVYQAESGSTYSQGSWTSDSGCDPGYKSSEWLHCPGGFLRFNIQSSASPVVEESQVFIEEPASVSAQAVSPPVSLPSPPANSARTNSGECIVRDSNYLDALSKFRSECGMDYQKILGHDCDPICGGWVCMTRSVQVSCDYFSQAPSQSAAAVQSVAPATIFQTVSTQPQPDPEPQPEPDPSPSLSQSSTAGSECIVKAEGLMTAMSLFRSECGMRYQPSLGHDCDPVCGGWVCMPRDVQVDCSIFSGGPVQTASPVASPVTPEPEPQPEPELAPTNVQSAPPGPTTPDTSVASGISCSGNNLSSVINSYNPPSMRRTATRVFSSLGELQNTINSRSDHGGAVYQLARGTYNFSGTAIDITNRRNLTVYSDPSARAVLDGGNSGNFGVNIRETSPGSTSNVDFIGFAITRTRFHAVFVGGDRSDQKGGRDIYVGGNVIYDAANNAGAGITVRNSTGDGKIRLEGNDISRIDMDGRGSGRGEGIYIGEGNNDSHYSRNVDIIGNRIHNMNGEAIDVKRASRDILIEYNRIDRIAVFSQGAITLAIDNRRALNYVANLRVRRNHITNVTTMQHNGNAIVVGMDAEVEQNVISNIGSDGIDVYADATGSDKRVDIRNNSFSNISGSAIRENVGTGNGTPINRFNVVKSNNCT